MEKTPKLTDEQKARFAPMLRRTWGAIADDAGERLPLGQIVEVVCDANRPEMFGGMSREDYNALSLAYSHRDTQKWLRATLRS